MNMGADFREIPRWDSAWRNSAWESLPGSWDLIVIGGGITGAGILRESTRLGLRALLLEAGDFASGTSSRSSKMVHGGLRYLRNAQIRITLESVSERERLLREGRGLINRLGFLFASLKGDHLPGWAFRAGLVVYDLMAMRWSHRHYSRRALRTLCPPLTTPDLRGGYRYFDALTDDARLVLRVLQEASANGGLALNYARVARLLSDGKGEMCGVVVVDQSNPQRTAELEIHAPVIINATGAWSDKTRALIGLRRRLRPLRGSHLIFPTHRLPLNRAVSLLHPDDGRPVYALPWEGVILVGTTDVDHSESIQADPTISHQETDYLLRAVMRAFPDQSLTQDDVQATFSGIRAVVDTGKSNPSKESREHVIWEENGLLTVSGGKLTTFRLMARDALKVVRHRLKTHKLFDRTNRVLDPIGLEIPEPGAEISPIEQLRLAGRYGNAAPTMLINSLPVEIARIGETPYLWTELRWSARSEGVVHLDDLLLRRIRLGLLLPGGGAAWMEQIRPIVMEELGWDEARWTQEADRYLRIWKTSYGPVS